MIEGVVIGRTRDIRLGTEVFMINDSRRGVIRLKIRVAGPSEGGTAGGNAVL